MKIENANKKKKTNNQKMSAIGIVDELTFDVKKMMRETITIKRETIVKIKDECKEVNLDNYNWSNLNRNTWFICMNDKDNEAYYFPICESENRDNNYKRVKDGMRFFKSKGWLVYQIQ